jgi:nitroreductase
MNTFEAIYQRRSIRKFNNKNIDKELIEKILDASTKAPSSKNMQPWRFFVLENPKKNELVGLLKKKLTSINKFGIKIGSIRKSMECMEEAPITILVFNAKIKSSIIEKLFDYVPKTSNILSIGASIQTMLLAAEDLGLSSLWLCDVIFFRSIIGKFINTKEELIAAIVLGYSDEKPDARPRKNWKEITKWI